LSSCQSNSPLAQAVIPMLQYQTRVEDDPCKINIIIQVTLNITKTTISANKYDHDLVMVARMIIAAISGNQISYLKDSSTEPLLAIQEGAGISIFTSNAPNTPVSLSFKSDVQKGGITSDKSANSIGMRINDHVTWDGFIAAAFEAGDFTAPSNELLSSFSSSSLECFRLDTFLEGLLALLSEAANNDLLTNTPKQTANKLNHQNLNME
jgi:hypothetical protein